MGVHVISYIMTFDLARTCAYSRCLTEMALKFFALLA